MIPIKDLNYSICYTLNVVFRGSSINYCKLNIFSLFERGIVIFFVSLKFAQTLNQLYRAPKHLRLRYLVSSLKVSSLILQTYFSYKLADSKEFYYTWIFFLIFTSTFYYLWDIIIDFDLCHWNSKNFLLRDKLYYPKKYFYYLAMFLDMILRVSWTLTLAPHFFTNFIMKSFMQTVIGILEIFRRCIWNFIKIEVENAKFEQEYCLISGY